VWRPFDKIKESEEGTINFENECWGKMLAKLSEFKILARL
jgi:hypothetical protein